MKVRFTRQAAHDLRGISNHIRGHDPAAAERVKSAIEHSLAMIAAHPHLGRVVGGDLRRHGVPSLPYVIYCRADIAAKEIAAATIRHQARGGTIPS